MFVKLDQWLRGVWAFWDTHGTRLLGVVGAIYNATSAVAVVLTEASPKTAGILLVISAILGGFTRARGQTNAAPPAPPGLG